MKKIVLGLVVAALLFGCASKPAPPTDQDNPINSSTMSFEIIEHKGTAFGATAPAWVVKSLEGASALERMPEYEGKYVVIAEQTGGNLNAVQRWTTNFVAASEFSRRVSTRVEQSFSGAMAGDLDDVANYVEEVVNTISEATFSGITQEGEWWVKIRWFDEDGDIDREEYRVMVLMTIDRDILDEQIRAAIEGNVADENLNDNEQRVRDMIQQGNYR